MDSTKDCANASVASLIRACQDFSVAMNRILTAVGH
jgi:hypothetical protein